MFLNKYKNKRKLGKGGYGDVYLVQDNQKNQFALKVFPANMIRKEPQIRSYIKGEIKCMETLNSPNIIKLHHYDEAEDNIYLILEYCDGGDLIMCQSRQKYKVFSLDKATEILAQIIIGLEHLHKEGYLHRDIKPQNVLMKKQNDKEVYKLADFGFAKRKTDIGGTVLGTDHFMSPEIYFSNEGYVYGFEVDMWAFGVLFYFMLNMEYPFKLNSLLPDKKAQQLKKQAQNFSYSQQVSLTRKNITQNCTPEMQDLFKKIFQLDVDKRITFEAIRRHPIFSKHFPNIPEASTMLYSQKFNPLHFFTEDLFDKLIRKQSKGQDNIKAVFRINRQKSQSQFSKQYDILEIKKEQINFLIESSNQLMDLKDLLKPDEIQMVCYNITKYYLIKLKDWKDSLSAEGLNFLYPGMRWSEVMMLNRFKQYLAQVNQLISSYSLKIINLYDNCKRYLDKIQQINPVFVRSFEPESTYQKFKGAFKESYRKSTAYTYQILRKVLAKKNHKGNRISYTIIILVICHAYNNLLEDYQYLPTIFKEYYEQSNETMIDFSRLREWLSQKSQNELNIITRRIISTYFP